MQIPIDQIDTTAFPRDRTLLDAGALEELEKSILTNGLRTPIEVWHRGETYFLISGLRRLTAHRRLVEHWGFEKFATIEATLREPASEAEALAMMVEENDVRADLSPWERSAIAMRAIEDRVFGTLDEAVAALYPHATRQKRARIRAIAEVVAHLDGLLVQPESHSQQTLMRISSALSAGWGELIETALTEARVRTAAEQLEVLKPVLGEYEDLRATGRATPDRPRRLVRIRHTYGTITLRREAVENGYVVHITGPGDAPKLIREMLDFFETRLAPG